MSDGRDITRVCARCGFRPHTVMPPDAIVAVRSLPRRWRELMTDLTPDEDRQALLEARTDGGWSVLEHAGHVAGVLALQAQRLRQIHDRDRPVLDHVASPVDRAGHGTLDIDGVLAELSASAEALALVAESISGEDWQRSGTLSGREVSAVHLLREAVHEGTHHLRDASAALAALRGRGADEEEPR